MSKKEFTKDDLVNFGNYLLGELREQSIENREGVRYIHDCDIANWIDSIPQQTMDNHEYEVVSNKALRRDIDEKIQDVKNLPESRERSIAITKLQEAVMWIGMDLKRLNEPNPYPSSKDPCTGGKIEPTADSLKL